MENLTASYTWPVSVTHVLQLGSAC